jgi:hypothetical protein
VDSRSEYGRRQFAFTPVFRIHRPRKSDVHRFLDGEPYRAPHVYMPPETGMAHYSYLSPDRKQVLVIEMADRWLPCRLVPFDGSSSGKRVGPAPSQCTNAAWSPDGKWMYFSAETGSGAHTWRQRFPDGTPEQVTFGVTREEGIETGGLWVADLESGQRQRLLPDFQMRHYTISADGRRVVFVASDDSGHTPVWLAALNGLFAPRRLADMDNSYVAYFGAGRDVVFDGEEKGTGFLYHVKDDGSELHKILAAPNLAVFAVSPDGRWVTAETPSQFGDTLVYPAGGGSPTLICGGCSPPQGTDVVPARLSWTPDGRFLYLKFAGSTYAIPLQPGQMLPPIPASGFPSKEAVAALSGARLVAEGEGVYPGPNPSVYAFLKVATQRNIYRVPVP